MAGHLPLLKEDFTTTLEGAKRDLQTLASNPDFIHAGKDQWQSMLMGFVSNHPLVELGYMTGPEGTQCLPNVVSSRVKVVYGGDGLGVDRSSRGWFSVAAETGQPYVSNPYLSVATLRRCVTVSAPVVDDAGTLLGVVAVDMRIFG